MKTCAICHAENDPLAPSCVSCGEGTWVSGEPDTVRRPVAEPAQDELPVRRPPPRRGARSPS